MKDLIIVVGNDDDASEVTLVPLNSNQSQRTPREKGALGVAAQLRKDLLEHWGDPGNGHLFTASPPNISVMTVQRVPTISSHNSKGFLLATEYGLAYAIQHSRIITAINRKVDEDYLGTTRQLFLLSVCRASRPLLIEHRSHGLPGQCGAYYNHTLDIIILNIIPGCNFRAYSNHKIRSIGIPAFVSTSLSACDVRSFHGLQEIVILLGQSRSDCQMKVLDVGQHRISASETSSCDWRSSTAQSPFLYAAYLRQSIERHSKLWNEFQRSGERRGRPADDWVMPTVRVARMVPISETANPYKYQHGHH